MFRLFTFLAAVLLTLGLFSCQKDNGTGSSHLPNDAANLILGKWTLQQEHVVQYINGVKHIDTVLNAAFNSYATVQFNTGGSFNSASFYSIANIGTLSTGGITVADSTEGTYSIAGQIFSTSAPIAGFANESTSFYGTTATTTAPVITPVSHSTQITQLTTTALDFHTEYIYTLTTNNVAQTYKQENDYAYSK